MGENRLMDRIRHEHRKRMRDRYFRSYSSVLLYAVLGSFIYSVGIFVSGFQALGLWIFFCCLLFLGSGYIFYSGRLKTSLLLTFIGISFTVNVSLAYAGLGCEAQLYFLSGTVLFFLSEISNRKITYSLAVLCIVEYIATQMIYSGMAPIYDMSNFTLSLFKQINTFFSFGVVIYTSIMYRQAVHHYEDSLKTLNRKNRYFAYVDTMTGLENRRAMENKLKKLIEEAEQTNVPFVVGIVDIDNFKSINDNYGHPFGDTVLIKTGQVMKNSLRSNDFIGRWGGEEFLIMLPSTSIERGLEIFERIRTAVVSIELEGMNVDLSVTIGCAEFEKNDTLIDLIRRADERLYYGKTHGKNRVVGYENNND